VAWLSEFAELYLHSKSLEDSGSPHSNLHGICTWIVATSDSSGISNPLDYARQSKAMIKGKSVEEACFLKVLIDRVDLVCIYLGAEEVDGMVFLRLWDGSTRDTVSGVDAEVAIKSIEVAVKYAEARSLVELKRIKEVIPTIIAQPSTDRYSVAHLSGPIPPLPQSTSALDGGRSLARNQLHGAAMNIAVLEASLARLLKIGLKPGTWLRIRNLHLESGRAEIHNDTHICTLPPYCRYVQYIYYLLYTTTYNKNIFSSSGRDVADLVRSFQWRLRSMREELPPPINAAGHGFTNLVLRYMRYSHDVTETNVFPSLRLSATPLLPRPNSVWGFKLPDGGLRIYEGLLLLKQKTN
jgi:hypothetical protein